MPDCSPASASSVREGGLHLPASSHLLMLECMHACVYLNDLNASVATHRRGKGGMGMGDGAGLPTALPS